MKKFLLLVAFVAAGCISASAEFQFGMEAGYDYFNIGTKVTTTTFGTTSVTKTSEDLHGLHIGPAFHYVASMGLGADVALYYQFATKDNQAASSLRIDDMNSYTFYHGLQIPLRINYTYNINDKFGVFAFAGPVLDFALVKENRVWYTDKSDYTVTDDVSGKTRTKTGDNDPTETKGDSSYKMFDVAIGGGVGVRIGCITLSASYDYGLINHSTIQDISTSVLVQTTRLHTQNVKATLGVRF